MTDVLNSHDLPAATAAAEFNLEVDEDGPENRVWERRNYDVSTDERRSRDTKRDPQPYNPDFPLHTPRAMRQCLSAKRILFVGHSHMNQLGESTCAGLHVKCKDTALIVDAGHGFVVRKLFDGRLFTNGSAATLYDAALRLRNVPLEAIQYDAVFFGVGMWDLLFYNTHPVDLYQRTVDAVRALVQWVRPGGQLVFYPLHKYHRPTWPADVPCGTEARVLLLREATWAAVQHAVADAATPVRLRVFDLYGYTDGLPRDQMERDGHHLSPVQRMVATEALLRGALNCSTEATPAPCWPRWSWRGTPPCPASRRRGHASTNGGTKRGRPSPGPGCRRASA